MSPAKLTARRILSGGVLFTALGAIGAMSALPATADQLVWGNAQAWVADGDAVAGYSTATGFGGETEGSATTRDLFGPIAPYLEIDGESRTVVDDEGARATSVVRSARFRMEVADLAAHGLIDLPPDAEMPGTSSSPSPSPEGGATEEGGDGSSGDRRDPEDDGATGGPEDGRDPEENGTGGDDTGGDGGQEREPEASAAPTDAPEREPREEEPSASPSPAPDEEVLDLAPGEVDLVSGDGNAVEFTLTDVTTTASARFDGTTEATFEHGELTAFGAAVGTLEAGDEGLLAQDVLEVFDEGGEVALEVPVSVRFAARETAFQDEDSDWEGEGVHSWMSVWVQVGEAEEEQGFAVDFADSWTLGSVYASEAPPEAGDKDGEKEDEETEGDEGRAGAYGRLATTGSSLAALITAAVVAVGGGSAATFLARKRTTAMDDRID